MDTEKLVKIYLKMRKAKADVQKEADAKIDAIKADMVVVENLLMGALHQAKAKSMATDAGTFYREKSIKPSCADWGAYHNWLIERGDLSGMEKRVSQGFILDYMKEHKGELPPGINTYEEDVVRVRVGNN